MGIKGKIGLETGPKNIKGKQKSGGVGGEF